MDDEAAPARVDLREGACFPAPPVPDQGLEVSCVAQALAQALYCAAARRGLSCLPVCRLPYPPAAQLQRAVWLDPARGTSFGAALRTLEDLFGPDLRAMDCRATRLPTGRQAPDAARQELQRGAPVVAGYLVDALVRRFHEEPGFCAQLGYVLPSLRGPAPRGHCVLLLGYDDAVGCCIARNSWGPGWGFGGHFLIRYGDLRRPDFFTELLVLR